MLERNVGGFYNYGIKTRDANEYKKYFSTARVSQVIVKTMKKIFQQWSELYVFEAPTVQLVCSSYNVSWALKQKKQRNKGAFVSETIL